MEAPSGQVDRKLPRGPIAEHYQRSGGYGASRLLPPPPSAIGPGVRPTLPIARPAHLAAVVTAGPRQPVLTGAITHEGLRRMPGLAAPASLLAGGAPGQVVGQAKAFDAGQLLGSAELRASGVAHRSSR